MPRPSLIVAALAAGLLALAPVLADARPGGGTSSGSRGSRTYSAPPATNTAPGTAAPMQRSMTEPGRPGYAAPQSAMPQTAARPGFFGGGFMSGLMGGIIGVGLGGLLFGHGLFGGGGFSGAGFLGLLLQIALIGGLVWLVLGFLRRRQEPALAGMPQGMARQAQDGPAHGGGGGGAAASAPVNIGDADFRGFEQTLQGVNAAWSRQDMRGLQQLCTPEMVQYFADDLAELASRGLRNETRDVKLEQGDLAEAWNENGRDYATVAMRFSLLDATFRMADNSLAEGSTTQRTQATETWTFVRARGGNWLLSAIQQNR